MASRSRLTLFDESSLGLDAAYRYKFYNLLLEDVEKDPRTVIISTHLIDDLTNEEKLSLKENNVDISSIPLQKLFVYLTENSYMKEVKING